MGGSGKSQTVFRCLATFFVSLHFSRTNRRLRGRMLKDCRVQGQGGKREVCVLVGLRQVLVTSLTFSWFPRTRLGYIMVLPVCTLRSAALQFENKMSKKFAQNLATWAVNQFAVLAKIASCLCFLYCKCWQHQHPRGVYWFVYWNCITSLQQVLEATFSFGLANLFSSIYLMLFLLVSFQN